MTESYCRKDSLMHVAIKSETRHDKNSCLRDSISEFWMEFSSSASQIELDGHFQGISDFAASAMESFHDMLSGHLVPIPREALAKHDFETGGVLQHFRKVVVVEF